MFAFWSSVLNTLIVLLHNNCNIKNILPVNAQHKQNIEVENGIVSTIIPLVRLASLCHNPVCDRSVGIFCFATHPVMYLPLKVNVKYLNLVQLIYFLVKSHITFIVLW